MMSTALNLAVSCGFTDFYWAHDARLWDGTVPFAAYASLTSQARVAAAPTGAAQSGRGPLRAIFRLVGQSKPN